MHLVLRYSVNQNPYKAGGQVHYILYTNYEQLGSFWWQLLEVQRGKINNLRFDNPGTVRLNFQTRPSES